MKIWFVSRCNMDTFLLCASCIESSVFPSQIVWIVLLLIITSRHTWFNEWSIAPGWEDDFISLERDISSVSSEAFPFIGLEKYVGFISFVVSRETLVSLVSSETNRRETAIFLPWVLLITFYRDVFVLKAWYKFFSFSSNQSRGGIGYFFIL